MEPTHVVSVENFLKTAKWQKKTDRPGAAALVYRGQSFGWISTSKSLARDIKTRLLATSKNRWNEDFGIEPYLEAIQKQRRHRKTAEIHLFLPRKNDLTLKECRSHVFAQFPSVLKNGPNYTTDTEELLRANFPKTWKQLEERTTKIWWHQWEKKYGL